MGIDFRKLRALKESLRVAMDAEALDDARQVAVELELALLDEMKVGDLKDSVTGSFLDSLEDILYEIAELRAERSMADGFYDLAAEREVWRG